ncbi:hypothetical protein [Vannielia sp.]|uniref:hypothetical protein n=1 Tax=Vannielia sp. TaxID=2813045 RepID=UPI002630381A|nr:hypothetical protein [Vannielia sp.]MDF1871317.1 hypothetical protein [Vannielia sp.]
MRLGGGLAARALGFGTVLLLVTGAAAAGILEDMVPPPPTDGACWERSYSNDHLALHPRQKVTELRFLVQPFQGRYDFTIDIATRERAGTVTGSCTNGPAGSAVCRVACGGGAFNLRQASSDNAILLDISGAGRLHINARCEGREGAAPFLIEAEPDDKVFKLQPTSVRSCTLQPFKPYLDHRGE